MPKGIELKTCIQNENNSSVLAKFNGQLVAALGGKKITLINTDKYKISKYSLLEQALACGFIAIGGVLSAGILPAALVYSQFSDDKKKLMKEYNSRLLTEKENTQKQELQNFNNLVETFSIEKLNDINTEIVTLETKLDSFLPNIIFEFKNLQKKYFSEIAMYLNSRFNSVEDKERVYEEAYFILKEILSQTSLPYNEVITDIFSPTDLKTSLSTKQKIELTEAEKKLNDLTKKPALTLAKEGIKKNKPILIDEGASGTYLLKSEHGKPVGIFKPSNEEAGQAENPKGRQAAVKTGIKPGNNYYRERLAYKLDRRPAGAEKLQESKKTFANIPYTKLCKFPGHFEAIGSFQEFVPNSKIAASLSPRQLYSLSKEELHRMAIQDIRMLNTDRHFGNFLVDSKGHLTPIDHGLCFPVAAKYLKFWWQNLEQFKWPLSQNSRQYVVNIDLAESEKVMRKGGLPEEAIQMSLISTQLLKECVAECLTLAEISELMTTQWDQPKDLKSKNAMDHSFFQTHICKRILEQNESKQEVINDVVNRFIEMHQIDRSIEPPLLEKGWERTTLGDGLDLFQFKGRLKKQTQQIAVLRMRNPASPDAKYKLQLVGSDAAYAEASEGARITMSKASKVIPGFVAMLNGGFFYYSEDKFSRKTAYHVGEPAGAFILNGNKIADNPNLPLWGALKISNNHDCSIGQTIEDAPNVLGCAPILIQENERTDLSNEAVKPSKANQEACPPAYFNEHINSSEPRSAIGIKGDGTIFLVCVEGRQLRASGMTGEQLEEFLVRLGAEEALNLDGGGSAKMLVKVDGKTEWVAKSPHFHTMMTARKIWEERPVATAIAIVEKA